ncbi:MAG: hypothetical protein ACOXZ9_07205 [Bacteroidales bacterium]|jgi:hypothetical protein
MKIIKYIVIMSFCVLMVSCETQYGNVARYEYKIECLGVELDGSQTLKAWGRGRNRSDAIEQAKKNAVYDVLFNGIRSGRDICEQKPVLLEVNAHKKYEDYFNKFFRDKGEYLDYVSLKDEKVANKFSRNRKKDKESVVHGLVVRIDRSGLKKKMIEDGIIK